MGGGNSQVQSENSGQHADDKKAVFEGSITEKKRSCTDVLILLCIIAAWFVMTIVGLSVTGVISSDVLVKGDPNRLTHAMDYNGDICGSDSLKNKPYGYYMADGTTVVCISSCPTKSILAPSSGSDLICKYNEDTSLITSSSAALEASKSVARNACMYKLQSDDIFYRCIPSAAQQAYAAAAASSAGSTTITVSSISTGNTQWFQAFAGDVYEYQGYVFGFGIGVAAAIALAYLYLLRIPGLLSLIIWSLILSIFVSMIVGAFLLWQLSVDWKKDGNHSSDEVLAMEIVSYIFMGLSALYLCLMLVMRKRIELAIAIVKEAARALAAMPLLTLFPVFQVVGIVLFLIPWVIFIFYMASSGEVSKDSTTGYRTFTYSQDQKYAFLYMLFCWFWTSEFIIAIGQLVIALSFATWYFTRDKKETGNKTVLWSLKTVFWNHLGTAAFGSLIIAIIQTIRAIIAYFERQARKANNKVMEYVLCIIQCCMWCVEKCMKFLNKNAYIQTAIYGTSFCTSARRAFFLILRNILRVAAVSMVGDFVLLIGKLFVPVITVFICYLCMAYGIDSNELNGIISPLAFVAILSYFIACMFSEIFGMGIESILCCYIADEEMFDTPEDRYGEGDLAAAIQKTNQASVAGKVVPGNEAQVAQSKDEVLM